MINSIHPREIFLVYIKFIWRIIVANIKSQIKRIEISNEERLQNKSKKSRINTEIKKFRTALSEGKIDEAQSLLKSCTSLIDSARLDGVYHKNTASRKISTITREFNQANSNK